MSKVWYTSKLLWVGVVTALYGVLKVFGIIEFELSAEIMATVLGVIVFILRLVTKKPIVLSEKK